MGALQNFFNWYHDNGIIPNLWKGATGQLSQEKMNTENIDYQKERNKIEDARYTEETAYNRAFAEDQRSYERSRDALSDERYANETAYNRAFAENERDYQRAFAAEDQSYQRRFAEEQRDYDRALQQQIFEREDTALERQAQSLSKLGINPLSQNMSGLGAGSVVSSGSAPGSSAGSASAPALANQSHSSGQQAPALSGRGGKALQNMAITSHGIIEALGPINEMVNSIANLNQQGIQRDVLREQKNLMSFQAQRQQLENMNYMAKNGIKQNSDGSYSIDPYHHSAQEFSDVEYRDKNASANRNERVDNFQEDYNVNDMSTDKERLATGIISQLSDGVVNNAVQGTLDAVDNVLDNQPKAVKGAAAFAGAFLKSKFNHSPFGYAYNTLIKPKIDSAKKRREERKKKK